MSSLSVAAPKKRTLSEVTYFTSLKFGFQLTFATAPAASPILEGCETTSHRPRCTLTRSAARSLPTATRQRAPSGNVFDVSKMIYVCLQRYFIQVQQFQCLLQR